jgi:hypothetical protein
MRSPARSFQNLVVWRKAHQFVLSVYDLTGISPGTEIYGLTSQLTRSAVSIAANIAERFRKKESRIKCVFLTLHKLLWKRSVKYWMLIQNQF